MDEANSYSIQLTRMSSTETTTSSTTSERSRVLDLSVVIVNYNVREFLEQALRSVYRAGEGLEMEVFVVDNDSVDGSPGMVREQFPHVQLIVNKENVGFSRANNQAIRLAEGRFLLILNPDTIVQEDTLTELVSFMEAHPEAGAVGCKILHPDGSFARESRRAFPTPQAAFYRLVGLASLFPRSRTFGKYNMTYLPEDEVAEVDALSGSCMMVRRKALFESAEGVTGSGAGLLDEDFFMYGEDLDWCRRIQKAGWHIYYYPYTQIIHYKGESTKKGELRYVRLFYGAMLRFTEKHLQHRYSRMFAALLRAGILTRAFVSLIGESLRRFTWPLLDIATVYAAASAVAFVHASSLGTTPSVLFFAAVAPVYALGAAAGIAAAGGYGRRRRLRSVWIGLLAGMVLVASISFFVKDIAFSRVVVLITYPAAGVSATLLRLAWARRDQKPGRTRRAVLVGQRDEAARLVQMLARHPRPPFLLSGFVATETPPLGRNGSDVSSAPARLGRIGQLRDIVRLAHVDDVVFASAALSNEAIFTLIQQLKDLPVHFRILAEGRDHLIGKASVDNLSMVSLVEAEDALVHARSSFSKRAFELGLALMGILIHPILSAAAALGGEGSRAARIAEKTRKLPGVLSGRYGVVGYDADRSYRPPDAWGLKPGVFPVSDAVDFVEAEDGDIGAAYWFYVRNQSASLDWDIVMHSLQRRW